MRARIKIDPERVIGAIDRHIYGQFMCRRPGCSEGGLYDPQAPNADADGLRSDVAGWIGNLRPPLIRWPGGCTGTSYHWLDGVGPRENRPKNIDLHFGWPARYDFGTAEFIAFCRRIGAEPHLNFAMGAGTLEEAAAWLEYCNLTWDTTYANLRRKHGYEEPFSVKYWQLGNENYGPWEIGHPTHPESYAEEAREWAKVLRRLDSSIKLLAVGGDSHYNPEWVRAVVPEVLPFVDYITFHTYWRDSQGDDPWTSIMSGPHEAEQQILLIDRVIKTEQMKEPKRRYGPPRDVRVACTEWNAAPEGGMMGSHPVFKPFGPTYSMRDALAVASFINIMQRHCQRITLATVAQSINVVGLIMVNAEGAWREPIYWPLWMQVHHSGPLALDAWVESPTFADSKRRLSGMAYLDCSATLDPEAHKLYLSLVNRHRDEPIQVDIRVQDARVGTEAVVHELYHEHPTAMNTPQNPDNVTPSQRATVAGSRFEWELKPHAYAILELDLG